MPKRKPGVGSRKEVLAALTQPHPRNQLYGRIIASAQDSLAGFLRTYPEWAGDERSQRGTEFWMLWIGDLLNLLDEYDVQYPQPEDPEEKPP